MAWYVDTSAAVKLVVRERESAPLVRWLRASRAPAVSSDLLRTELLRATRRGAPSRMLRAREVLDSLPLLAMTSDVFERAAELEPLTHRSLDALHLAAALGLGDELHGILTYDERMAQAATLLGVAVRSPGQSGR
jgi:predicted nucleic acid-binding protein